MRLRFRAQAERFFTDLLQVGTLVSGQGTWGADPKEDTYSYDVVNTVRCLIVNGVTNEFSDGSEVQIAESKIKVPSSNTSITMETRLKVTRRYRKALVTNEIHRVVGIIERPNVRVIFTKEIEGNASR